MLAIIPLAGRACDEGPSETAGPFRLVDGDACIQRVIHSRRWWESGEITASDLVFVLRETDKTQAITGALSTLFPGCRCLILPNATRGILLTAVAGAACSEDFSSPLVVDRADQMYESQRFKSLTEEFAGSGKPDAVVPVFPSDHPELNYAAVDPAHPAGLRIRRTAIRETISGWAIAGSYIFRNASLFLTVAGMGLSRGESAAVEGEFQLSPIINDLIALGYEAQIEKVGLLPINQPKRSKRLTASI